MAQCSHNRMETFQAGLAALLLGLVFAAPVWGSQSPSDQMILLNGVDTLAFDQPRAVYQFRIPSDPPGEGDVVGPGLIWPGLLDTGAQAILLEEKAYIADDIGTVDPNLYEQATRDDGSLIFYEEIGIAGVQPLDLYVPHDMLLADDEGVVVDVLPAVRMIGDPALKFGSFSAIIGTPAMVDRVSVIDLTPLAGPNLDFLSTSFAQLSPRVTPNTYHVDVGQLPPDPSSGQQQPGDPPPALEALPQIEGAIVGHDTLTSQRDLIVDTGGQISVISLDTALSVGIDPDTDALDFLPISGIGGDTVIPIVALDEITVPTREGVDLVFRDLQVGVIDVAGLDGVFGMNALSSGYIEASGTEDPDDLGWFETIIFDFTASQWVMRLDMNPVYDAPMAVPEPSSLALLASGSLLLLCRPRGRPGRRC